MIRIPLKITRSILASGFASLFIVTAATCAGQPVPTSTPTTPADTPTPEPTATPTNTPTPTPVPLTVDEVLANAEAALDEAGTMFFVLDHENGYTEALGGLQLLHIEGEVTENAMRINAEANIGRVYVEVEAILIDQDAWLTNPLTGDWELLGEDQNPIGFLKPIETIKGLIVGLTDARYISDPSGEGDYEVAASLAAESLVTLLGNVVEGSSGDAIVAIDRDTFHLKSAQITGALQVSDNDDTARIIEIGRYGEPFSIQPPEVGPAR